MEHIVFTYGSLKQGHRFHDALSGSEYLGDGYTVPAKYTMFHNNMYPAIVETDDNPKHIGGEVYKIDDKQLERLDQIEGNGMYYQREQLPINIDGGVVIAWVYLLMDNRRWGFHGEKETSDVSEIEGVLTWRDK